MSNDLTRTIADIGNPLPAAEPEPSAMQLDARRAARELIDAHPGASLVQLVTLAFLEGRLRGMADARTIARDVFDNSTCCQRCGRRISLSSSTPTPIPMNYVCFDCSAGDEPRAA